MSAYYCQAELQKRTDLYRPSRKSNSFYQRQVRVGSFSLFTFPVTNQEYTIETPKKTSKVHLFWYRRNDDNGLQVNLKDVGSHVLKVYRVAEKNRQDEIMMRFFISFEENNMTEEEKALYSPLFKQMADKLKALPVENEHVTVGRQDGTVTFYLYLGKELLLTVSKAVSQLTTDEVMFSISLNKKVMVVDRMHIAELLKRIEKTYSELA